MLWYSAQIFDIFLNIFWGAVVIVHHSKDSVYAGVVEVNESDCDSVNELDKEVHYEMQLRGEERADSSLVAFASRCW